MSNEKLYLTIDTKLLNCFTPEDTTVELKKEIEKFFELKKKLRNAALKFVFKKSTYVLLSGF